MKLYVSSWVAAALLLCGGGIVNVSARQLDFADLHSAVVFRGDDPAGGVGTATVAGTGRGGQIFAHDPARQIDLSGYIAGTFGIGPITGIGVEQMASLFGTGTITLNAFEMGPLFSARIEAERASIEPRELHSPIRMVFSLSDIHYSGASPPLLELASAGTATLVMDVAFVPFRSLLDLTADGTVWSGPFRGTITTVPEPGAVGLLGIGLLTLGRLVRRVLKS